MNTSEMLKTITDMLDMPSMLGMNTDSKWRWEQAAQVIRNEMLLYQAEKFKHDVMAMAKEIIGEFATPQDVITIMSDKTTDNQKIYNVYLNTKRDGSDANSVESMKKVKNEKWRSQQIPVSQYTLDGKFVREWESISEAARGMNIRECSISAAIHGRSRSSCGYIWKQKDDDTPVIPCVHNMSTYAKPVGQYSMTGKLIHQFRSIRDAAKSISVCHATLRKVLDQNTSLKGYKWKSLDTVN